MVPNIPDTNIIDDTSQNLLHFSQTTTLSVMNGQS